MVDKPRLFDPIIHRLKYLHERLIISRAEPEFERHALVTTPGGKTILYTLQLLTNYYASRFAIYKSEGSEILTQPAEFFSHQLGLITLLESAKIKDHRLIHLAEAIEKVSGKISYDVHEIQFIPVKRGISTIVYNERTKNGEASGFSFQLREGHNYHMLFRPEQKLTTALEDKIIDEVVEDSDLQFIFDNSNQLIDWAYHTMEY